MNDTGPGKVRKTGKAEHGAPSEVSWDGGQGRQPYGNQEDGAVHGPLAGHEVADGDRGELSGRNLDQLEQVRKMP